MAGRKQNQSRLNLEYPVTSSTWGMLKLHLGLFLLLKFSYRKMWLASRSTYNKRSC